MTTPRNSQAKVLCFRNNSNIYYFVKLRKWLLLNVSAATLQVINYCFLSPRKWAKDDSIFEYESLEISKEIKALLAQIERKQKVKIL